MVVSVTNEQRESSVNVSQVSALARRAVRRLDIKTPGTLAVTFIDSRRMRALNKRFLHHDRVTDVLSFRYDDETPNRDGWSEPLPAPRPEIILAAARQAGRSLSPERTTGEILIAPRQARAYAKRHGIPYQQELSRYVVHGLLHWMGHEDRTIQQRRKMRRLEDWLLGSASADPTRIESCTNRGHPPQIAGGRSRLKR